MQSRDARHQDARQPPAPRAGLWGATLLGDGTVILILNPADLAGAAEEPRLRAVAAAGRCRASAALHDARRRRLAQHAARAVERGERKAGWNPLQARDGVEALELMTRAVELPDLILLDIEMPRMDGYEFLATARAQPALRAICRS